MSDIVKTFKKNYKGVTLCLLIAVPAFFLGKALPLVGGPVFGILLGMLLALVIKKRESLNPGITFTSKKILQYAIILLGFGLNLSVILATGKQSLPIILSTITTSLVVAYILCKLMKADAKSSILVGVGSSICGGSAIAATAPVIDATDEEIAQSISVIFLFNVIAALIFPTLGTALGMSTEGFGLFAGTAVNDTSSVTAAASAWDGIHPGSHALEIATIVKLTRTLAIIPITLALAFHRTFQEKKKETLTIKERITTTSIAIPAEKEETLSPACAIENPAGEIEIITDEIEIKAAKVDVWGIFPKFILYFLLASILTTILSLPVSLTAPIKEVSKFFIIMAMSAIGLNTNIVKLIKTGGKPIFMGFCCWVAIALVSLIMQHLIGIW